MKIRKSFVEKIYTVTAVSRVREVGDSELSNICGQQSSVSLLCVVSMYVVVPRQQQQSSCSQERKFPT